MKTILKLLGLTPIGAEVPDIKTPREYLLNKGILLEGKNKQTKTHVVGKTHDFNEVWNKSNF